MIRLACYTLRIFLLLAHFGFESVRPRSTRFSGFHDLVCPRSVSRRRSSDSLLCSRLLNPSPALAALSLIFEVYTAFAGAGSITFRMCASFFLPRFPL